MVEVYETDPEEVEDLKAAKEEIKLILENSGHVVDDIEDDNEDSDESE